METPHVHHLQAVEVHDGEDRRVVVPTCWRFAADDPYAVTLSFRTRCGYVDWTFARSLLAEGFTAAAGEGDVRLAPLPENELLLLLEIESPSGRATFDLDRTAARRFLDATTALVPLGEEHLWVDLDAPDALLPSAPFDKPTDVI